ncbi:hypothetical protein [Brevundimonas sp. UBA5936]|jgi:hypothetical protein|uniref:hypothetical protein n=1 Tax=Brevundimonas sp. UBA5936 TaxID=1946133 RepID=UPI0025BB2E0A|nr:hypothetical protein [Brevundimonas sp. UBA5936]
MTQPRINARLEVERVDRIHNDLAGAAHHLKTRIDKALAPGGERAGVGLDIMAGITMLAFTFEAYLNFVGAMRVEDWNERASGKDKRQAVWKALDLAWDPAQRPASTLLQLIKARDMMAHGKPVTVREEWLAQGTDGELQLLLRNYQTEFDQLTTPEFFALAYEDVEAVWRMFLEAGKISVIDTFDRGMSGITFLSHAD